MPSNPLVVVRRQERRGAEIRGEGRRGVYRRG